MGSHHTKQYGRRPSTAPLIFLVPGTSPPVLQGSQYSQRFAMQSRSSFSQYRVDSLIGKTCQSSIIQLRKGTLLLLLFLFLAKPYTFVHTCSFEHGFRWLPGALMSNKLSHRISLALLSPTFFDQSLISPKSRKFAVLLLIFECLKARRAFPKLEGVKRIEVLPT